MTRQEFKSLKPGMFLKYYDFTDHTCFGKIADINGKLFFIKIENNNFFIDKWLIDIILKDRYTILNKNEAMIAVLES